MTLYADDTMVARNRNPIALGGAWPFLSASIIDGDDCLQRIEVFAKAIGWCDIRVSVDGFFLSPDYM